MYTWTLKNNLHAVISHHLHLSEEWLFCLKISLMLHKGDIKHPAPKPTQSYPFSELESYLKHLTGSLQSCFGGKQAVSSWKNTPKWFSVYKKQKESPSQYKRGLVLKGCIPVPARRKQHSSFLLLCIWYHRNQMLTTLAQIITYPPLCYINLEK